MADDRHLLIVDPSRTDLEQLTAAFERAGDHVFSITRAGSLAEALSAADQRRFDLVMLDLVLPDSQGIETFVTFHRRVPSVPVLVLTTPESERVGMQAVEEGAQDYLDKHDLSMPLVTRSVRYALERAGLQQALAESLQRKQQDRELRNIDRLSRTPGTSVTARMYSAAPLSETSSALFGSLVAAYGALLEEALEHRTYTTDLPGGSEGVRELAERLGVQRATPRDVIEVHCRALRDKTATGPWQRAQAYMVEGRLLVTELMGHLVSFYRVYCPRVIQEGR